MKKVDYEHFSRFLMPHSIASRGNDLYFCVKSVKMEQNAYASDLYRIRDGKVQRMTSLGDLGAFSLTEDGIVFPACRTKEEKEKAESGVPCTVFYRLPYDGGEAVPFLTLNVRTGRLYPAGTDRYFLTASESLLLNAKLAENNGDEAKTAAAMKEEADYQVIDEIPFYMNGMGFTNRIREKLYLYEDGKCRPLTGDDENCSILYASQDQLLISLSSFKTGKMVLTDRLIRMNAHTLEREEITLNDHCSHYGAGILPDGSIAAVINTADKHGLNQNPCLYLYQNGSWRLLNGEGLVSFGSSVGSDIVAHGRDCGSDLPVRGDFLYTLDTAVDHTSLTAFSLKDGSMKLVNEGSMNITSFDFWGDDFAITALDGNGGVEVYRLKPDGTADRLTDFNTSLCSEYEYSEPRPLSFVNERGTTIGGWILFPDEYEPGKKYPAILDIHGGPKTVYGSCYFHEMQIWASKGYFVFFCNPTGGDGQGDDFADIRGQYGEQDYRDVMRFTDLVLQSQPDIDPARVGVTGGSYGGFMTNWIIGHTDRFAAAASQRSISNWISFYNTSDIGYFFAGDQVDGNPWENTEKLWAQSPLKYANRAVTPTLFIHSDEDYRCPLSEGFQMFAALRDHGTEARMCIFKGENHELSRCGKPKHRVRRLKEITEWFDAHLKG